MLLELGLGSDAPAGAVTGTIERSHLRLVQTPQAFGFAALLDAHRRAQQAGREDFTDDAPPPDDLTMLIAKVS